MRHLDIDDKLILPRTMRHLDIDDNGYPIPAYLDDEKHWFRSLAHQTCWICGLKLGKFQAYLIDAHSSVRSIAENPANHPECAIWTARHDVYQIHPSTLCVWICRSYTILYKTGKAVIRLGQPLRLLWFMSGRRLSPKVAKFNGLRTLKRSKETKDNIMESLTPQFHGDVVESTPVGL